MSEAQQHGETAEARIQAIAEARTMLSAFMSVGISNFGVTRKNVIGEVVSYRKIDANRLLGRLSKMLEDAERECHSVIVRPFYKCETSLTIVQADDLDEARKERITPFAFCVTETSPANFQAFLCVLPGDDYRHGLSWIRRHVNAALDADSGATCAARLAGTLNTKQVHCRSDGSYPRVRLIHVKAARVVKTVELREAGLFVDVQPSPKRMPYIPAPNDGRFTRARRLPSYEKALASVQLKDDGKPDRSAADLLFAVTCLRWSPSIPKEEIASLLMRHSEKAQERKKDVEWYVETTIDEALRRA